MPCTVFVYIRLASKRPCANEDGVAVYYSYCCCCYYYYYYYHCH